MKIHNKRELQQIAIDHSADIDYKDFVKIYRNCTNFLLTILRGLERILQILFYKNDIN